MWQKAISGSLFGSTVIITIVLFQNIHVLYIHGYSQYAAGYPKQVSYGNL